jgi:predicted NACHT family NTPase
MSNKVGVAEYRQNDYIEILRLAADRDNMDPTWSEWKMSQIKAVSDLKNQGIEAVSVIVEPAALLAYCLENGHGNQRAGQGSICKR